MKRLRENISQNQLVEEPREVKIPQLLSLKDLIIRAIEINDDDGLEELLKNQSLEVLSHIKNIEGESFNALQYAAKIGHKGVFKKLIDLKKDVNSTTSLGNSALHIATNHGHIDIVDILLGENTKIEVSNLYGLTALHLAAIKRYPNISKMLLLKLKPNLDAQDKMGNTPLHYAAAGKDPTIVSQLLLSRAKVNIKNNFGETPLLVASSLSDKVIAELLLQANSDPKAIDYKDETPLHKAAALGKESVMLELLLKGADLFSPDIFKSTPLHKAAENGEEKAVILLLGLSGDNLSKLINVKDSNGNNALHLAAKNGHLQIVNKLLLAGSTINSKNDHDESALILAAKEGHEKVVDLLLTANADLEIENKEGYTAFLIAAKGGHIFICEKLKNHGANINAITNLEENALHLILDHQGGPVEKVSKLIDFGVDITPSNGAGYTAFQIGAMKQVKESCKAIFNHSASINQVKGWMIERSIAFKPYHDMIKEIITDFIIQKEYLAVFIENPSKLKYLHLYQYLIKMEPNWLLNELGENEGINEFLSTTFLKFSGTCMGLSWNNKTFNKLPLKVQKNIFSYLDLSSVTPHKITEYIQEVNNNEAPGIAGNFLNFNGEEL